MPLSETAINAMLTTLASSATHVSAHTAEIVTPTSPNEVSGGSPAYARKTISWNTAASKNLDSSTAPVMDIPISVTVTHIGFWNHATNQTVAAFMGQIPLTTPITYSSQGTLSLTDVDWTGS